LPQQGMPQQGIDADFAQRYPALISLRGYRMRSALRLTAQGPSVGRTQQQVPVDVHCAERSDVAHGREPQGVGAQRRSSPGPASVDGRVEWLATPGPSLFKRFEWDEDVR
jgi:hypothetical protein